jgi:hypothetical protein
MCYGWAKEFLEGKRRLAAIGRARLLSTEALIDHGGG